MTFFLLVCITNNMMPSRHRCQVSIFSRQHTGCDPCLWLFLSIVIIIFSAFSWSKTENDLVMQHAFVLFVLRFYSSFIFYRIIINVTGYQDRHKSLDEFDFGPLVSMANLYVFWNEIWPWQIGLRWAIIALWATCFIYYLEGDIHVHL